MLSKRFPQILVALLMAAAMLMTVFPQMMTHASPLSVTLTPVSDATVSIITPNMNFGHDNTLTAEYQSSRQISRAIIRFNLAAALPSNAVIDSAWLNLKQEGGQGDGSLTVYLVTQDWIEGQVTWNNQPAVGSPILSRFCDSSTGVKGLEITDIVKAWHNTPHYGLAIRGPEGGAAYIRLFESREQGEYPPTLSVIYHLPTPTTTPIPTLLPTPIPTTTVAPTPTPVPTRTPTPIPTAQPTTGWCCFNGEVFQTTQTICSREGGQLFDTEEEAVLGCQEQPSQGWCCLNGDIFQTSEYICSLEGGDFFDWEEQAYQACEDQPPAGWCCLNGEVFPTSQTICSLEGGQLFDAEEEAIVACQEQPRQGWCCLSGDVFQTSEDVCFLEEGQFFEMEEQAYQACEDQPPAGWCCLNGEVFPASQTVCSQEGGQFFETEDGAPEACQVEPPEEGWCCANGEVSLSSAAACVEGGGAVFDVEKDALTFCQIESVDEGWCCLQGDVFPCSSGVCTRTGGSFFTAAREALENCQLDIAQQGWCCSNGDVSAVSWDECVAEGGSILEELGDAVAICEQPAPNGWCYASGGVFPCPGGVCVAVGGAFFAAAEDAIKLWESDTVPPEDLINVNDIDGDGILNEQDQDMDGDGIDNDSDNCDMVNNPDQKDSDISCETILVAQKPTTWCNEGDGVGDACDNCPNKYNKYQTDWDGDTVGDACDNCPLKKNENQADSDGDNIGDVCDNCVSKSNNDQTDYDKDQVGDACDNCIDPYNPNPSQKDSDGDGIGDLCDECTGKDDKIDADGDKVPDCVDNCLGVKNPYNYGGLGKKWQDDSDKDSKGDACDCDDGVQGSSEKGIDCGGSCTPCNYIAIKGRILYEDASADGKTSTGFKPVRFGRFQLRLCKDYPCTSQVKYYETLTDSQGYFNIITERQGIKSAYVYLGSQTDLYKANYAVRIARDLDGCNEYVYWYGKTLPIPSTGDLDLGNLRIGINSNLEFSGNWRETTSGLCSWDGKESGPVNGGSGYFNIAETILVARQYADALRDDNDSIGAVDVEWPDSEKSSYSSYWEEIQLLPSSGFNDGTICHEFGHHLEEEISENDDYWGDSSHSVCTTGKDEEFGWKEGFAEYFGSIVPHHHQSPDLQFLSGPNIGESSAENQCSCPASNEEQECTVLAVLWDLVDDPSNPVSHPYKSGVTSTFPLSINESYDTISGKEALIFSIFDNECDNFADAPDLCEFISEGWDCRLSGKARDAIDAILTQYNVKCSRGCGK